MKNFMIYRFAKFDKKAFCVKAVSTTPIPYVQAQFGFFGVCFVVPRFIRRLRRKYYICRHGIYIRHGEDRYGESWRITRIIFNPSKFVYPEPEDVGCQCSHEYDCCGCSFLMWYRKKYKGFILTESWGINV